MNVTRASHQTPSPAHQTRLLAALELGGGRSPAGRRAQAVPRPRTGGPSPSGEPSPWREPSAVGAVDPDHEKDRLHQLRSAVAGLAASSQLLHHGRLSELRRARLERLHRAELARVERLLRWQEAATPPAPVAVDVDATLADLAETWRIRGHQVAWRGDGAVAWTRPDDLGEILHNLVENALRHGGATHVVVSASRRADRVEVLVEDDGRGVPPHVADRLFERGARESDSPGQGLGLHIARRLATGLGADLRLLPHRPGRGAAFVLSLPGA